jgi:hypothetical protein
METRPFHHDVMRSLHDRFHGRQVADALAAHRHDFHGILSTDDPHG